MRIPLAICFFAGWMMAAAAQPALVCDAPEFNFPPTDNAGEIVHDFVLRNAGQAPLIIRRVHPDCGCLLVRTPPDAIAPGASIKLTARFMLKGRRGPQQRRITLFTNDPRQPRLVLTMAGEALAPAAVQPERLFWGNIRGDQPAAREALVEFQGAGAGSVRAVSVAHPGFAAAVETVATGRTYRIALRTIPPLAPGRFDVPVVIRTDHPRFPELTMRMSGRVVAAVFAIPDEIVLDLPAAETGANPATGNALAVLRALDNAPFQVLEVVPPAAGIAVRQRPLSQGGVRLELQNIPLAKALDGSRVLIRTDRADVPEIAIPLRVRAPEDR